MSKNLDLKRFDQKLWLLNMHRHTGLNFLRISEACVGNFERWETMYWNIHLHYSSWERIEGKNFCLCQNHKKWKKIQKMLWKTSIHRSKLHGAKKKTEFWICVLDKVLLSPSSYCLPHDRPIYWQMTCWDKE